MCRKRGWTLIELLVVIALIAALVSVLIPSVAEIRSRARLAACAINMRNVHQAVMGYAAANRSQLPPFSLSIHETFSLPTSGHWGGATQDDDPDVMGWRSPTAVNLSVLVANASLSAQSTICPGADSSLSQSEASYFPYSSNFSTYGLRFPYSKDLFLGSTQLGNLNAGLLEAYRTSAGGQSVLVADNRITHRVGIRQRVPRLRIDRTYRIAAPVACGDGDYDVASDVLLADTFWWQDISADATNTFGLRNYPISAGWCHGDKFNVLSGGGAVHTISDTSGIVRANSNAPNAQLLDDGHYQATYAEKVWQFFDSAR